MHPIKNPFFALFSSLYLGVQFLRYTQVFIPEIINSYLNDYLFLPLLLLFTLWLVRIIKRDQTIILTPAKLIFSGLYVSLLFEYYLPSISPIYTADKYDILAYFFGIVSYYIIQQKYLI